LLFSECGKENKNCKNWGQNTEKLGSDHVLIDVDSERFVYLLRDPEVAIIWKPDQATCTDVAYMSAYIAAIIPSDWVMA
jgi:hypothetical protein